MGTVREVARRETHARVLGACEALFAERGFADTTIRDIAAAAGVSAGTVIGVGDKDALLVAVFDRLIEEVHRGRSVTSGGGSAEDRVMDAVEPFIGLFTSRAELARAYASILASGAHASTVFTDLGALLVAEFRAAFGPDSDARAQAVYRAYLGTLFLWAASGHDDPAALSDDLRHTLRGLCLDREAVR